MPEKPIPKTALFATDKDISLFLDVDRKDIVFFQALFESYEGLATLRTIDPQQGIVSLLTTPSMLTTALEVLTSLRDDKPWRFATHLHEEEKARYVQILQ